MAITIPSLEELLKAGVHFGHNESRWHPKMAPFIFTTRSGVHIIHLEKTRECLERALLFVQELSANNKTVLFVGSKRQVRDIVEKYAKECGMPYITEKWIGGLFTNWQVVAKKIRNLRRLKEMRDKDEFKKYTKKERLMFEREIGKLTIDIGGIEQLTRLPDAIFIVDLKEEKTALREAIKTNIPVIAMVDTNINPQAVLYPIPANDDAIKSVDMIIGLLARAVVSGREKAKAQKATDVVVEKNNEPVAEAGFVADEIQSEAVEVPVSPLEEKI